MGENKGRKLEIYEGYLIGDLIPPGRSGMFLYSTQIDKLVQVLEDIETAEVLNDENSISYCFKNGDVTVYDRDYVKKEKLPSIVLESKTDRVGLLDLFKEIPEFWLEFLKSNERHGRPDSGGEVNQIAGYAE